jgi:uncharacterized NAD(P)/FAD-binding protein YdhS
MRHFTMDRGQLGMVNRIAIIGAGFSGTVIAANLLRHPPRGVPEIVLIERGADVGRGAAYAVHDFPYLLNVPAGRLSADSSAPLQFLEFARRSVSAAGAEDFLPRQLYGDYLQDFLSRAEAAARGIRLVRLRGDVTGLVDRPGNGAMVLEVAGREPLAAGRVILACGNPPPGTPPWAGHLRHHPAYRDDPFDLPAHLDPAQVVLVVGNGLTMVDVAYQLTHDGARAPRLVTISRRGLTPLPQSEFHVSAVQGGGEFLERARTVRELVAATRTLARRVEAHGGDWREAVTFVRNHAPEIWERLPLDERRRFLRHVQAYWDVHRHRLPLRLCAHLDALRLTGRLDVRAGRVQRAVPEGRRLCVTWRPRGGDNEESLVADAVVNATGPDYALGRSRNPLLRSLADAGLIAADSLQLGLATTTEHACIGRDGTPSDRLFYVGPMLRASCWEATAAAELRGHAEQLARHLADLEAGRSA